MAIIPLPLRQHPKHQEDLIWWAMESDGALGRKSVQGAIQARLEGSSGVHRDYDILEDPRQALHDVIHRTSFRAAGRLKSIERSWRMLRIEDQRVLASIYWTPTHPGLEAFGRLGNVVALSKIAHNKYERDRTTLTFGEWVTRLSARRVGAGIKGGKRTPPKANRSEIETVRLISRDCIEMLVEALENYVEAYRRVDISNL